MKKFIVMSRVSTALIVWCALLALSPAPINRGRPDKIEPEKTDFVRTTEQRGARMTEVGSVPQITEGEGEVPQIDYQQSGAESIVESGNTNQKQASQVVKDATKALEQSKAKSGGFNWFGGLFVLFGAFGLFQVFRVWANKNLPEPGEFR